MIAGELRYAYLDKGVKVPKLDKSLDPAEILRQYRAGLLLGPSSTTGKATIRAQTAPTGSGRPSATATSTGVMHAASGRIPPRKMVFNDGRDLHVIDAAPGYKGPISVDTSTMNWKPPHLEHK